jgi:hypothetical protein
MPQETHEVLWGCRRGHEDRGLLAPTASGIVAFGGVRLVIFDAQAGGHSRHCQVRRRGKLAAVLRASCVMCSAASPRGARRWSLPGSARSLLEPSPHAVRTQYDQVIDSLARELPAVGAMLAEAKEEVSHLLQSFPKSHWRTIWSTNPLERVNHEIKRRTNVVGAFPNDAAILALVTAVVLERHEELTVAEQRYLQQESMALLGAQGPRRHHRAQARKRCCAPAPLQGFHRSLRQRLRWYAKGGQGVNLHHSTRRDRVPRAASFAQTRSS